MSDSFVQTQDKPKSYLSFKDPRRTTWVFCWDFISAQLLSLSILLPTLPFLGCYSPKYSYLYLGICFTENPIWNNWFQEWSEKVDFGMGFWIQITLHPASSEKPVNSKGGVLIAPVQGNRAIIKTISCNELVEVNPLMVQCIRYLRNMWKIVTIKSVEWSDTKLNWIQAETDQP